MTIICINAADQHRTKTDDMCSTIRNVLCVKDVLMMIATVAKSINRTGNEIEKNILNNGIDETLERHVNFEMGLIQSHLPIPQYHVQFFQLNNIEQVCFFISSITFRSKIISFSQEYLGDLFLEAHYAMSFYYNSIEDLLSKKHPFTTTTDSWFKQIHDNLKNEMICRFRSILNVYGHEWPSISQVKRIEFSRRKYRDASALAHETQSIVIIRLLREWMQRIHSVIINLESKFY
jgi:hypothetical protein